MRAQGFGENIRSKARVISRTLVAFVLSVSVAGLGMVPLTYAAPTSDTEFADQGGQEGSNAGDAGADQPSDDENQKPSNDSNAGSGSSTDSKADKKPSKKTSNKKSAAKKDSKAAIKKKMEEKAKVATAKQAIQEMNALNVKLETAYEDLNEQQAKLDKIKKKITKTKKSIKNADKDLETAKEEVATYARETYVNGTVRYLSVLLNATSFGDFLNRFQFLSLITENGEQAVADIKRLQNTLSDEKAKLNKTYTEKKELTAQARANADAISNALLEQADYFAALPAKARKAVLKYDGVKNSIAAAAGLTGSTSKKGSHPEVATLALKYLGVNYVWGGETPSGFDCSGLVMYCYQKACGISLTHFARTQYSEGKHIAKSALMPGDLVFFGPDVAGIHHVGIYLGKDKFVHAPQTGDVVKISTLSSRSDYVGACRP